MLQPTFLHDDQSQTISESEFQNYFLSSEFARTVQKVACGVHMDGDAAVRVVLNATTVILSRTALCR